MNSKMKHTDALKRNQAKCAKYKAEGRREINKAKKADKISKRLAKAAVKRTQLAN
jgi:hypothetical protein